MWVIEGKFRGRGSNNSIPDEPRQRWLRPSRIYSLGRDAANDFSLEIKSLPRFRAITLDVGPWTQEQLTSENDSENVKPYPLTFTSEAHRKIRLVRETGEEIVIEPEGMTGILPGDKLYWDRQGAQPCTIRFSWNPVSICFSAMSPQQRKSVAADFESAGFSFSEARFPGKYHTHFLPRPLKPTLAAGCALIEGIQIVSEVWLKDLLAKTKLKPTQGDFMEIKRAKNESDEKLRLRTEKINSLPDPRFKGTAMSDFENDYQNAWDTLKQPELAVKTRVAEGGSESWFKDSKKWGPNPARRTMLSDLCFVILACDNDEDVKLIERIVNAGRGVVHRICPTGDDALVRSLLSKVRQARPKKCVFMRTPQFSLSSASAVMLSDQLKASLGIQNCITVEDLLCSLYQVDSSHLIRISSGTSPQHTQPQDATDREPLFRQSSMLENEPETVIQTGNTQPRLASLSRYSQENRMVQVPPVVREHASTDDELLPAPTPSIPPPRLIRRAGTRTEEVRAKELDALLSHSTETASEIEQLKLQARIDDLTDNSIAPTLVNLGITNPVEALTESNASHESVNDDTPAPTPTLQLSGPPATTRKLPPKRKARAGGEIDLDKYMPFLSSADPMTGTNPAPASTADISQELSSRASKRRKVEEATASGLGGIISSGSRIEEFDIDKIEGPATRMMRADAEQAKNPLKRKELMDSYDDGRQHSQSQSQEQRPSTNKKARKDTKTVTVGSLNHSSAEDEPDRKTTPRKKPPGRRGKPGTTAKSTQASKDDDEPDSSDQFLTVKTTGKRLTEEEKQTNLAFNRLRISKPPLMLQTQPIASRRIEWDEEDAGEEEIREMDGWTQKQMEDANAKSFFKVKYVNMIRKPIQPLPEVESTQRRDSRPNFKKFKPKCQAPQGHFSASATPRINIMLETVRLKRGGVEDWEAPKKSKDSNTQIRKDDEEEEEAESESDDNTFRKFTGKKSRVVQTTPSRLVKKRAQKQPAKSSELDHTQTPPSSDAEFHLSRRRGGATTSNLKGKATQVASSSSVVRGVAASRSVRNHSQAQQRENAKEVESESGSEGDELAFKGFRRAR